MVKIVRLWASVQLVREIKVVHVDPHFFVNRGDGIEAII
jgi:hypothetical protein